MSKYHVEGLFDAYAANGIRVHHHPFEDGGLPTNIDICAIVRDISRSGSPCAKINCDQLIMKICI